MIVTRKMKDAVQVMDRQTNFNNKWVVFYPLNPADDDWDCELSPDAVAAREFFNEMKSQDNYGDAAIMPIASCY